MLTQYPIFKNTSDVRKLRYALCPECFLLQFVRLAERMRNCQQSFWLYIVQSALTVEINYVIILELKSIRSNHLLIIAQSTCWVFCINFAVNTLI